ncbi:MAG: QacE [Gammaproteobacteria bacterium HGW-Gammaproteobacteria-15]|nr:MAG: QacE [Gammaproteobacteria bacterium HGW-Gammaproteobacteria-15]
MEEKVFFNQGNVTVSNSRFIVNGQTYAMSNVTSVKSGEIAPNHGAAVILGFIGLACLLGSGGMFFFGLLLIGLAIYMFMKNKPTYSVILNTASGENQALTSTDKQYIVQVINSLNESIVNRG